MAVATSRVRRPTSSRLVRRPGLFARLSGAGSDSVLLVCGPAGSGKTMLVSSWLTDAGFTDRAAWVVLERGERDPQQFWLRLVDELAALEGSIKRLSPTPAFRGEAVVDHLLVDLRANAEELVLVIDDLHELQSFDALALLERFITRRPPNLRIVLTSRTEPHLNLHRLRLAGELTEIRGRDLRFSPEEAVELFRASGIELPEPNAAMLQERTEGWATGLRLAAISMRSHPDPVAFVTEFAGSDRSVGAYLMAEVLERQEPAVREVLLRTSILDRVTGRLADAMTGSPGSERILLDLEDANAFVTAVDSERTWFRYHNLFSDFLRLELRRADPGGADDLHRIAAHWYEEHGHPAEAIRHAQAGSDWRSAARVLADSYVSLILDGRLGTVAALLDSFPAEVVAEDAELALAAAAVRLLQGRIDEAEVCLAAAAELSASVSTDRRTRFDLRLASTGLWLARHHVDLAAARSAMHEVETALAAQPATDMARAVDHRAAAVMNFGIAELWSTRPIDARRHLEEGLRLAQQAERPYLEIACLAHLGIAVPESGGSVLEGVRFAEQAIARAEALGWSREPIVTPALVIGAVGMMWLGRLGEAEQRLDRAAVALRAEADPMTALVFHWAKGLLLLIQGRPADALEELREAQDLRSQMPDAMRTIEPRGLLLQALVRMSDSERASAMLAELDPEERDRALIRIAAAELEIARDEPSSALALLDPVIAGTARSAHQTTSEIDALLLQALAWERMGDGRRTEAAIERALELAEPEGIIVPFAVAPVGDLLRHHPRHRTSHAALLSEVLNVIGGSSARERGAAPDLAENLSEAELRVARFLPTNLTAPEIAAELFVSANTVRTHLRHIYSKLDAHSRAEAVERARELGLLAPSRVN